jgi:hypothetical protein
MQVRKTASALNAASTFRHSPLYFASFRPAPPCRRSARRRAIPLSSSARRKCCHVPIAATRSAVDRPASIYNHHASKETLHAAGAPYLSLRVLSLQPWKHRHTAQLRTHLPGALSRNAGELATRSHRGRSVPDVSLPLSAPPASLLSASSPSV